MGIRIKIDVSGIEAVVQRLGSRAASDLRDTIDQDVGVGTRRMARQAAMNAPVDTGALKASILSSTERDGPMEFIFGSYMPYAQRQEYEHKTKRGYFRRAVWAGIPELRKDLTSTIKRRLG